MRFDQFCSVSNLVLSHYKQAEGSEGGLMGVLKALPAPALGALLGGGAGLVTGAFSDQPGSMLRHGLIGAGLGAGVGYGGSKLMEYLNRTGAAPALPYQPNTPLSKAVVAPPKPSLAAPDASSGAKDSFKSLTGLPEKTDQLAGAFDEMRNPSKEAPFGLSSPAAIQASTDAGIKAEFEALKSTGAATAKLRGDQAGLAEDAIRRFGHGELLDQLLAKPSDPRVAEKIQLLPNQMQRLFAALQSRQNSPQVAAPSGLFQRAAGSVADAAQAAQANSPGAMFESLRGASDAEARAAALQEVEAQQLLQSFK